MLKRAFGFVLGSTICLVLLVLSFFGLYTLVLTLA